MRKHYREAIRSCLEVTKQLLVRTDGSSDKRRIYFDADSKMSGILSVMMYDDEVSRHDFKAARRLASYLLRKGISA